MKSNLKKRILAFMLCMVMVLSSATSVLADDADAGNTRSVEANQEVNSEPAAVSEEADSTAETQGQPDVEEESKDVETEQPTVDTSTGNPEGSGEQQVESTGQETANDISVSTIIDGTTITMSGSSTSFPQGSSYEISASKLSEDKIKDVEIALKKKELEENTNIARYQAYDIKLLVDGTEAQPTGNVNVTFEGGEVQEKVAGAENVEVYHINEEQQIASNIEKTVENNTVEMTTNHFSTYVITTTTSKKIEVNIQHFIDGSKDKIFADSTLYLDNTGSIDLGVKGGNYEVTKIVKVTIDKYGKEVETEIGDDRVITEDTNYRVYYTATKEKNVEGGVTFYDYQINPKSGKSINDSSNYPKGAADNTKLAIGNEQYRKQGEKYVTKKSYGGVSYKDKNGKTNTFSAATVNINNWSQTYDDYIYKDIITGVDIDTGALLMGTNSNGATLTEPGLFTDEEFEGKQVYKNYKLNLDRDGNTYRLSKVTKNGVNKATDMSKFFPLDDYKGKEASKEAYSDSNLNYYFGMRYDIEFSLEDYIGELNYSFSGDDDLWVVLDGTKVVVDVGGIHDAMPQEVDLWTVLLNKQSYSEEDKTQYVKENGAEKHRLTVLYLERGANLSNCNMYYTLPNSSIIEVNEIGTTSLSFTKVDSKTGAKLAGAGFTLYKDAELTQPVNTYKNEDGETVAKEELTSENGTITLENLKLGDVYYLKETTAPDGYIPSDKIYKITVAYEDGKAVAKLFAIDDEDETAITEIPNQLIEEFINEQLVYDKTAQLIDWDKRTYQIKLNASSIKTITTEGGTKEVDVALVLDRSNSMNYYGGVDISKPVSGAPSPNGTYYYYEADGNLYRLQYSNNRWRRWTYYVEDSADAPDNENHGWKSQTNVTLDTSLKYYTGYSTRLAIMKRATCEFIDSLAEISPNSNISITAFAGSASVGRTMQNIGENKDSLKSYINGLSTTSSTNTYDGLVKANGTFSADSKNEKFTILLSDGVPTTNKTSAENFAATMGQKGITIHTIGFFVDTEGENHLTKIANNGNGKFLFASGAASLVDSFDLILESVITGIPIQNATVKDYIDSRFEVTDINGVPLPENSEISDNLGNKGLLKKDGSGNWYVVWSGITIPPKNSQTGNSGWSANIYIKARDNYIGGNAVTTNQSNSSIVFENGVGAKLPQPTVNVKAELDVSNQIVTIYKGDVVPTEEAILNSLFDTKYIGHYGVEANDFNLSWYTNEACTEGITAEELTNRIPDSDTTFYLKVTYDAGIPTDQSNTNTTIDNKVYISGDEDHIVEALNDGKVSGKESPDFKDVIDKPYGIYKVKVISGEIQLTKNLEKASEKKQVFKFNIKKDGKEFKEVSIVIPAGETSVSLTSAELKDLPRGSYEITEVPVAGYDLQNLLVDNAITNCENYTDIKGESATFVLGNNTDKENVIKNYSYNMKDGGTVGKVEFTNAVVFTNWDIIKRSTSGENIVLGGAEFKLRPSNAIEALSKPTYYGRSSNDGIIEWYSDKDFTTKITTDNLEHGSYILTEEKAPTGYSINEENWTIEIGKGGLKSITSSEKEPAHQSEIIEGKTIIHFYFENTPVYDLPSAGGYGIYWYSIGGMLLMIAAALILYKNKCREVLKS